MTSPPPPPPTRQQWSRLISSIVIFCMYTTKLDITSIDKNGDQYQAVTWLQFKKKVIRLRRASHGNTCLSTYRSGDQCRAAQSHQSLHTGGKPRNYHEIVLTQICSQATSGKRRGSFQAENWINKGWCHVHFCFIL